MNLSGIARWRDLRAATSIPAYIKGGGARLQDASVMMEHGSPALAAGA
jgi:hypothetical protein